MAYVAICNDVPEIVTVRRQDIPTCSSGWLIKETSPEFDVSQIDFAVASAMLIVGFFLCVPLYWAASVAKHIINTFKPNF